MAIRLDETTEKQYRRREDDPVDPAALDYEMLLSDARALLIEAMGHEGFVARRDAFLARTAAVEPIVIARKLKEADEAEMVRINALPPKEREQALKDKAAKEKAAKEKADEAAKAEAKAEEDNRLANG